MRIYFAFHPNLLSYNIISKEFAPPLMGLFILMECMKMNTPEENVHYMSGKGVGEDGSRSVFNKCTEILDFFPPSIVRMFEDDDIIFQDDNASCHKAKYLKEFTIISYITTTHVMTEAAKKVQGFQLPYMSQYWASVSLKSLTRGGSVTSK